MLRRSLDWCSAEVVAEGGGELLLEARSVSEHSEGSVEGPGGDVVAFGPLLPRREGLDVEPLLADGGQHGVEELDGVAVAKLIVRVPLVGDCVSVAFDGRRGSLAGPFEVVLGPLELVLGDVEVVAGRAPLPAWGGVESVLGGGVASACLDGAGLGVVQGVSVGGGCCRHLDQHGVGAGRGRGCLGPSR